MFARSLIFSFALFVAGVSAAIAETKTVCPDPGPHSNAREEAFFAKAEKLQKEGYVLRNFATRSTAHSYIGTGLRLGHLDELGIIKIVIGTVPGSPAARTEFFDQPYIIFEIDGKDVFWDDIKKIQEAIIGNGKANTGVTLTLQRVDGGRDYVRFIERKRITIYNESMCVRYWK